MFSQFIWTSGNLEKVIDGDRSNFIILCPGKIHEKPVSVGFGAVMYIGFVYSDTHQGGLCGGSQ